MSWFPSSGAQSEEDGRGCRLNHRHLRHFISPTLFSQAWGSVCVGQKNSLTSSLVPSFPPSFPHFLPRTTHFYMNSFVVVPPQPTSHICHPPLDFFLHLFSISTCLSLSLSLSIPHSSIPLVFCHGRGKENEQPESQERRGWRKEKREQGGELCPAEEERDGCSTCRDSAHCTRSSCPCDGSSRQELSMREQNAKKKKRATPNGAAAERNPIHPRFFSSSQGTKLFSVQTCTVDFSALTISDPQAPPSRSPLPGSQRHSLGHFRSNCVEFSGLRQR